jgi:hypothetical protein
MSMRYIIDMMKKDPQFGKTIRLPAATWAAIAEYRFTQRIGSEAEAIRQLLDAGLRTVPAKPAKRGSAAESPGALSNICPTWS